MMRKDGGMKVKPIIFSAPMVRALIDGRKTMTRRVLKPQPRLCADVFEDGGYWYAHKKTGPGSDCVEVDAVEPGYAPGDLLWVREAFFLADYYLKDARRFTGGAYKADETDDAALRLTGWRSPIHMPRWASRLTLEVTNVKVERLHAISEEDAKAEGVHSILPYWPIDAYRSVFRRLWDDINARRPGCSWADNPFVAAISFRVHKCNVDELLNEREKAA